MRFSFHRKKKGKNPFEASMPVDNPDIKLVTASYKREPFFIGIGLSEQRKLKGTGQVSLGDGVKGEYQSQKDIDWQLLYNPNALPPGFVPLEKAKELMASTVAATSGSVAVYLPETKFTDTTPENLKSFEEKVYQTKGKRLRELIDYELDHIIPLSEGGDNSPENLRLVKKKENRRKSAE